MRAQTQTKKKKAAPSKIEGVLSRKKKRSRVGKQAAEQKKVPGKRIAARRASKENSDFTNRNNKTKPMSDQTTGKKGASEGQSVDKIREILFGEQMASYDQKFAELETSLRAEVAELKKGLTEELRQNVAELKALVQQEKAESNDRNVARRQLGDKLQKLADEPRK